MNSKGILGIILLAGGVALLVFGLNASHSVADQMSNTFTGKFTQDTMWYIIGGIALGAFGLLSLVMGVRGKSA
ncbi:MAG: DUF3185 family protein [Tepidisphaeraceae bacterium]|jgi:hypothetical protein